ncbi:MAG TPA: hypothetical protein RMG45_21145, partial [Polyangiaceae bacterium LLY-WYZ-15_(1-7)]|nr:hypothetical protein [Polyangiaceae bacterium LLY-WYZ-15_(1-7)]
MTADAWHLAGGHLDGWVDVLAARSGPDEDRAAALWRAATLAAQELGDFGRAKPLYEQASLHAPDPTPILRSLHEAAREAGDDAAAADAIAALLGREVDPEERSALLHERVGLLKASGEDEAGRDPTKAALTHALGVEAARAWAADAARVHAAEAGDHALLAKAHLALAERAVEEELAAAHRVAAARALARGGDDEAAIEELRGALERSPGHPYAVALLEQIYRSRGEADEVVRLLREAAAAHTGSRAALVELLLAGAAAEAAGDASVAAETYEEAADLAPEAVSPLWALERLASKTGDDELLLRAREGLSEREIAEDAPARATLELGEHYAHVDKPELAEGPLRGALESPVGPEAAASLALLPEDRADPMARLAGLRVLAALPEDGARLSRELGATAEIDALDPAVAEDAAKALLARSDDEEAEDDLWALLSRIASATADGDFATRAELLLRLAGRTRDPAAGSDLTLHALRAKIVAEGAEATDDAFLLAQELAYDAHGTAVGAVAADETLEAGDDPDTRADALLGRLVHTADATRSSLVAAAGRALAAARRPEAVARLREVLESDPHDLASWEALRVAARDQGEWEDVVRACDTLADALEGADRHEMREEAAAALMDHLDRPDEAEQRLREVVEADRSRPNAYFRLHDLLVDRGDEDALLELVEKRIHAIDDGAQLERLFYEKARLHRSRGELDAALEAIENLVMLDEQHVGGIALAVEIHVSREDWRA